MIALPLRTGDGRALIAVANRPELRAELGIVHDQVVEAALLAVLVGAAAGLLIAVLISRRLRRIASAASAIEQGGFDTELRPRFHDELGDLAETIDRMREHLRTSFSNLESERDRLRRLLERLHEGVIAVDRDLRVQFANGVAAGIVRARSLERGRAAPRAVAGALVARDGRDAVRLRCDGRRGARLALRGSDVLGGRDSAGPGLADRASGPHRHLRAGAPGAGRARVRRPTPRTSCARR